MLLRAALPLVAYWLVLLLAYAAVRTAFDLVARGYVDLRWLSILELAIVPTVLAPLALGLCVLLRRKQPKRIEGRAATLASAE